MPLYTFTLYGSDSDVTGDYPDVSAIEALGTANYESVQLEVKQSPMKPAVDTEEREYIDGTKASFITGVRLSSEIITKFKRYPETDTVFEDLFFVNVINKKNIWININDFPVRPDGGAGSVIGTQKAIPCSVNSFDMDMEKGHYELSLEIQGKKAL